MKVKVTQSYTTLCNPEYWNSSVQNTEVGSISRLHGVFPTQGLKPGLPHCKRILYQLSHKGSPRILEWVAYPFSSGSSRPRNRTRVSDIAGGVFTKWTIRDRMNIKSDYTKILLKSSSLTGCIPSIYIKFIGIDKKTKLNGDVRGMEGGVGYPRSRKFGSIELIFYPWNREEGKRNLS